MSLKSKSIVAVSTFLSLVFLTSSIAISEEGLFQDLPDNLWTNGYHHQTNVITPGENETVISAQVEGVWQQFSLVQFPEQFMKWNKERRLKTLDDMELFNAWLEGFSKQPSLSGPHNGMVASYGFMRNDSLFKLNNAVKGMGFLPKRSKIKEILKLLADTRNSPQEEKVKILKSFYTNFENLFDLDKQISLELYSEPKYVTQTFLNQVVNPISTVVFLDFPTFKFKSITRLLDANDPSLTDYEKDIVKYINDIHSYFHGNFPRNFIGVVYYAVEVYDSSPGSPSGRGRRIAP